jgi:hypothetical protein
MFPTTRLGHATRRHPCFTQTIAKWITTGYGAVINDGLIALIMLENPSFFRVSEELAHLLSHLLAKIMAF